MELLLLVGIDEPETTEFRRRQDRPVLAFVERMLTVVAPCRQQDVNVLDFLTRCYQPRLGGQPVPSLLPAAANTQAA